MNRVHVASVVCLFLILRCSFTPLAAERDSLLVPEDTVPALNLSEEPYFVAIAPGDDSVYLEKVYYLLRGMLEKTVSQNLKGTFSFQELEKKCPTLSAWSEFSEAEFIVSGEKQYIFISCIKNEGFLPVYGLRLDDENEVLYFRLTSRHGESVALSLPLGKKTKG